MHVFSTKVYTKILNYCKNVIKLDSKFKFVWLMTTENTFLVENLGHSLIQSFKLRSTNISDG
jgi:hypothetical protein